MFAFFLPRRYLSSSYKDVVISAAHQPLYKLGATPNRQNTTSGLNFVTVAGTVVMMASRICVFCGSSTGRNPIYLSAAAALANELVARGISIVYGGGKAGLMGVIAETALAAGGEVIGVMPRDLVDKERAHLSLTQLYVVASMHERKALMAELADAFIALPGGYGTFEEFCEVLTWTQLGLHRKPCGILNVHGYYNALLNLFDHALDEEFVRPEHREMVISSPDPEALIDLLLHSNTPLVEKWLTPQST